MKDLFTIAFPVYNRTDFIKEAMDSAVNQSVPCRILLIDNYSPHNEFEKIAKSYNNPLIRYVKTDETVHQDENFNNCIRYCETPWLTILHDDDTLHHQYVEFIQKIIQKDSEVGCIAVKCNVDSESWPGISEKVELTDKIVKVKESFFYFSFLSAFPGVSFKKDIATQLGFFNVDLHPIADNDFWYRLTTVTKTLLVQQELAFYRISPTQSTNRLIDAMINNMYTYRLNLIKNSKKYNNFLTRLTLEHARLTNIRHFSHFYNDVQMPEKIVNEKSLKRAERLLSIPFVKSLLLRYRRKLSFETY